ncbi:DUF192 domain-containing protein [Thermococcus sp.]
MIINETKGKAWHGRVEIANTFFKRFRGLMLVSNITYSLVFILPAETRANASIHTFFMLSDIDVIWLDSTRRVVDFKRARKWRLYAPKKPAKYIIEGPVGLLQALDVEGGDLISWSPSEEKEKAVPVRISLPEGISFNKANGIAMTESIEEVRIKS